MRIDEGIIDEDNLEKKSELPKRQLTTKSSNLTKSKCDSKYIELAT